MARTIPHQITLFAFVEHEPGALAIADIVETSFRNASHFTRDWLRSEDICRIAAVRPGCFPTRKQMRRVPSAA